MQDKLIEAEIDDGILGVVLVLNDAGVKTFSSCQGGGYGWGHGYLRPIVCFDGDDSEGERAEKIATDAGYQVFQVQRVWYTRDGERVGPFWEMEFVAGAACRAPKDRAAVRAHDAGTDEELRKVIHILRTTPITPEHGFECGTEWGVAFSTGFGHAIKILEKASASHAAESAAQLDAEDQHRAAEPVEDVVSRMCRAYFDDIFGVGNWDNYKGDWHSAPLKGMTAALAVANQVRDDQWEATVKTQYYSADVIGFPAYIQTIKARLAPKPSLAEEFAKILERSAHLVIDMPRRNKLAEELAALVERRAGK